MQVELAPERPSEADASCRDEDSQAIALLPRILEIYAGMPWDETIARDFAGAIRTLALLDPAVAGRLREGLAQPAGRARLIEAALDALGDGAHRPQAQPIAPGHGWLRHRLNTLATQYERLR
jgi:hypothetical protein